MIYLIIVSTYAIIIWCLTESSLMIEVGDRYRVDMNMLTFVITPVTLPILGMLKLIETLGVYAYLIMDSKIISLFLFDFEISKK